MENEKILEEINAEDLQDVSGGLEQEKRTRHIWEIYCTKCGATHSKWRSKPTRAQMPLYCRRCSGYKHFEIKEYDEEF